MVNRDYVLIKELDETSLLSNGKPFKAEALEVGFTLDGKECEFIGKGDVLLIDTPAKKIGTKISDYLLIRKSFVLVNLTKSTILKNL